MMTIKNISCILTDRSDTARMLVESGANVFVRDENGQTCMAFMVTKMAPVVSFIDG